MTEKLLEDPLMEVSHIQEKDSNSHLLDAIEADVKDANIIEKQDGDLQDSKDFVLQANANENILLTREQDQSENQDTSNGNKQIIPKTPGLASEIEEFIKVKSERKVGIPISLKRKNIVLESDITDLNNLDSPNPEGGKKKKKKKKGGLKVVKITDSLELTDEKLQNDSKNLNPPKPEGGQKKKKKKEKLQNGTVVNNGIISKEFNETKHTPSPPPPKGCANQPVTNIINNTAGQKPRTETGFCCRIPHFILFTLIPQGGTPRVYMVDRAKLASIHGFDTIFESLYINHETANLSEEKEKIWKTIISRIEKQALVQKSFLKIQPYAAIFYSNVPSSWFNDNPNKL